MTDDYHIGQYNCKNHRRNKSGMSVGCTLTLLKAMPMSEKVKRNIAHINTICDQTPQIKFG